MSQRNDAQIFDPGAMLLEKYKVLRVLGEGGMGVVLEAENVRTGRRVAVKALPSTNEARVSAATQRFVNEARAAARLAHPNSVDVFDLERDDTGTLFIVQEFLQGQTLYDRLQRERRIPWREAIVLLLPVMSALAEAHRKGIVHRDVKPENIFLSEAAPGVMVPKIIDFGIARLLETDLRLTRNDRVLGTPYYMSPEQATGANDLDGQTDVWAVGVVLYECITGRLPFDGKDLSMVMRAIVQAPLVPMRTYDPTLPAPVAAAIERALARDRGQRYATMQHFLDVLIQCVGETCVGVGRIRALTTEGDAPEGGALLRASGESPPSSSPALADAPRRNRWRADVRLSPWTVLAFASMLTLGVAVGAFLSIRLGSARRVAMAASGAVAQSLQCSSMHSVPAAPTPPHPGVLAPIASPTTPATPSAPTMATAPTVELRSDPRGAAAQGSSRRRARARPRTAPGRHH
jgi:serine/threonine-protein kinase